MTNGASMRLPARLLGVAVLLAGAMSAGAEDWPQWRGPRGDGISKETLPDSLPKELKKLWSLKVGGGFSSPIAVQDTLYVFSTDGNKEGLTAISAAEGKKLWSKAYDTAGRSKGGYNGTRATPTFEDGMIYTLGEGGQVTCFDSSAEGKIVWQTNVLKETGAGNLTWGTASSPLIVGDRIYVQGGDGGPLAVGINKKTGKIEWQTDNKGQSSYAHTIVIDAGGTKQLVIQAGKAVYGAELESGKILWEQPFKAEYDVNATTPLYRDGQLLVSNGYRSGGAMMLKVTAKGATKVWANKEMQSRFPGMILDGDFVYGNSEGKLKCLRWSDGGVVWTENLSLKEGGTIVKAGDKLLVLGQRGDLHLIKVNGEKHEMLGEATLYETDQLWATPLLLNGKMYVRAKDELACFELAGK